MRLGCPSDNIKPVEWTVTLVQDSEKLAQFFFQRVKFIRIELNFSISLKYEQAYFHRFLVVFFCARSTPLSSPFSPLPLLAYLLQCTATSNAVTHTLIRKQNICFTLFHSYNNLSLHFQRFDFHDNFSNGSASRVLQQKTKG